MNECQNCGAPGGYPWRSEGCRIAGDPDYDDEPEATAVGPSPSTDTTDPWATDARNHL